MMMMMMIMIMIIIIIIIIIIKKNNGEDFMSRLHGTMFTHLTNAIAFEIAHQIGTY